MEILRTVDELQRWSRENRKAGKSIGLVPTMGALHAGHLAIEHPGKGKRMVWDSPMPGSFGHMFQAPPAAPRPR